MGRRKGSKNKPKAIETPKTEEKPVEIASEPVPVESRSEWKPEPVAKNLPPEPKPVCNCGHDEQLHYGNEDRWCNTSGCRCARFNWGS